MDFKELTSYIYEIEEALFNLNRLNDDFNKERSSVSEEIIERLNDILAHTNKALFIYASVGSFKSLNKISGFLNRSLAIANLKVSKRKAGRADNVLSNLLHYCRQEKSKFITKRRLKIKLFSYYVAAHKSLTDASLRAKEVVKILDMHEYLSGNVANYLINQQDLQTGDLLLSYKTEEYLKSSMVSYIISLISRTSVTHGMVVYKTDRVKVIQASGFTRKVTCSELKLHQGEVLIVLRPNCNKRRLSQEIKKTSRTYAEKTRFSMLKFWAAALSGAIYSMFAVAFKIEINMPNIFSKTKGFYCSEIIDDIFKEAGVYLTPRSKYDAVVSPLELLYSPYLQFVGVITKKPKELTKIKIKI